MSAEKIELTEKKYEDYLNRINVDINILGIIMQQGTILRKCNPIAFKCGMNDYDSFNEKWECTKCDSIYDNFDDAENCCNDNEE